MKKLARTLVCPASCLLAVMVSPGGLFGQPAETGKTGAPLNWTAQQDHKNMMDQLGITQLRPGPSGQPGKTNSANYDEAKANPFPDLPDVLTLKNGQKVTTAEMWWKQRRPEIVEDFEREVIGRVPKNVPKVNWTVRLEYHRRGRRQRSQRMASNSSGTWTARRARRSTSIFA